MIERNHGFLRDLGVSCSEIEYIIDIVKEYGYSAKLTGAGGGGCVIGFRQKSIIETIGCSDKIKESGFSIYEGIEMS